MNAAITERSDLHDPRLWQALAHAPDHGVAPDWRLRKAILKQAHDAVGESDAEDAEAELEKAAQSWWQHLPGGAAGRRRSWRPWPAGLAAAGVAALAVVLWQRGPARGPTPGDEAQRVAASAPRAAPAQPPTSSELVGPPRDPASIPLLPPSFFALPEPPAAAAPVESVAPPPAPALAPLSPTPMLTPPPKSATVPRATVPPPPLPAPPSSSTPGAAPVPRGTNPPPAEASARLVAPTTPPAPGGASAPPTFDALLQWNRITISRRGGESRSLPRAEAREVGALLGSAALSAEAPQPLKGAPEWRVTLERGAEVLAVFEVAGSQVRWREGRAPAATGTPSAGSLSALREALNNAVQAPEPPVLRPGLPPAEPPRAP